MRHGSAFSRLSAAVYLATSMSWATDQQKSVADEHVIRIQVLENGRLLVPVAVNENKEQWFLFDTGATTTVLSERVAKRAGVTTNGVRQVVTFAGVVSLSIGQVDTLCVGNYSTAGLVVLIGDLGRLFNLEPQVEGIVGQDILSGFNYLLDRRKGKLEIEEGGNLTSKLSGSRVACEKRGGKIYVPAAGGHVHLMLDSGNPYLVIYNDAVSRLQATTNIKDEKEVRSSVGSRRIRPFRIDLLEIGGTLKRNVEGYLATRSPGGSEDGFLPLFVFDSIYVNNQENFLIPNPKRNR